MVREQLLLLMGAEAIHHREDSHQWRIGVGRLNQARVMLTHPSTLEDSRKCVPGLA